MTLSILSHHQSLAKNTSPYRILNQLDRLYRPGTTIIIDPKRGLQVSLIIEKDVNRDFSLIPLYIDAAIQKLRSRISFKKEKNSIEPKYIEDIILKLFKSRTSLSMFNLRQRKNHVYIVNAIDSLTQFIEELQNESKS